MNQQEFQDHVIDTLARLDTNMTSLIGNGQPGRISKIETSITDTNTAVDKLKKYVWMGVGATLALSGVIHFLFKY